MNPTSPTFNAAAANACGRRSSMEDEHKIILEQDVRGTPVTYLAVFDGHGGRHTATWAADNLHKYLLEQPDLSTESIQTAFMAADAAYATTFPTVCHNVGCTAAVAIILPLSKGTWRVITAHAGDSRVLIVPPLGTSSDLSDLQDVFATDDHKPENPAEEKRIRAAGGYVARINSWMGPTGPMRANGDLSLSRALGDHRYKTNNRLTPDLQVITAMPDVTEHIVGERVRIVLACDGVFERMSNSDAVRVIRENPAAEDAARELVQAALRSGSGDNISVVVLEWRSAAVDTAAPTRVQSPVSDTDSDESWDAPGPAYASRGIMIAGPAGITVAPEPEYKVEVLATPKFDACVKAIATAAPKPMYAVHAEFLPNGLDQLRAHVAAVPPSAGMAEWIRVVQEKLTRMREAASTTPQLDLAELVASGRHYRAGIDLQLSVAQARERAARERVRELNASLAADIIPPRAALPLHLQPLTLGNLHQRHPLLPGYTEVTARLAAIGNTCLPHLGYLQYCTTCRKYGGH